MKQSIVVVNPRCHQGRGWKRWTSIRDDIRSMLGDTYKEYVLEDGFGLPEILSPLLTGDDVEVKLISAGGDGSIHELVNFIMKYSPGVVSRVAIGAVGLGSSNDFHKPFGRTISGIPVRISDATAPQKHDVGVADYCNGRELLRKYFVVNASVGVTANANWSFNNPGSILAFLKKTNTPAAIAYTAVSTILKHRNTNLHIGLPGRTIHAPVSNINLLKVPFVSGSFHYDQPVLRDDGMLGLNVCLDMNRAELIKVLNGLQKGRFSAGSKCFSELVTECKVSGDKSFVFECDGETEVTTSVYFSIIPRAINVLN